MAESNPLIRAFNRGLISNLALARTDLERVPLSAETMTNWMPRNLGPMMLRPGTEYIGNTASNNKARWLPFIYATDDTALLEITDGLLRVWVDDALITRPSVSTTVSDSDFTALTAWTAFNDGGGAFSNLFTKGGSSYCQFIGDGKNASYRTQEVTVAAGDQGVEHALTIKVASMDPTAAGYVTGRDLTLRVGSTEGDDDYIAETKLGAGEHSLSFTPSGNFWIEFSHLHASQAYVDDCSVASSGAMTLTVPWAEADLGLIRYDQSGDVIYIACGKTTDNIGYPQYKIERRSTTSWSVVNYEPEDGPFGNINTTDITITPANFTALQVFTASKPVFKSTDVGRLIRLDSEGRTVSNLAITEANTFTGAIRVTGVSDERIFTLDIAGTFVATVTLQRSFSSEDGPWDDVTTYTTPQAITYDDTFDNAIIWYRIGVDVGDYTSGTLGATLGYQRDSSVGYGRIYTYTSSTSVGVSILSIMGSLNATRNWYLGDWSCSSGYPTAVAFVEGRLGWAGRNKHWISVSDAYEVFDDETIGDSGPITRTIGSGPVDDINWMLGLKRVCSGTDSAEWNLRSSNEDEPLTPSSSIPKRISGQGSAKVHGLIMDRSGLFVQRGGTRLMEVAFNSSDYEYDTLDLSVLYPESGGDSAINRISLQRQPDNRIHCVREDGTVAMLLHDKAENVSCWVTQTGAVSAGLKNFSFTSSFTPLPVTTGSRLGFGISPDGTKMIIASSLDSKLYQFTLSTAHNIETAEYDNVSFDLTTIVDFGAGTLTAMYVQTDGTRIYVVDTGGLDGVVQVNLEMGWDLTTASDPAKTLDLSGETTNPRQIHVSSDGTKLFAIGGGFGVYQYTLSVAGELDSGSYDSISFDSTTEEAAPRGIFLDAAGENMYIAGLSDSVYQYSLDTANDISDPTLVNSFDISANVGTIESIYFRSNRLIFYGSDGVTNDAIVQYDIASSLTVIEDVVVLPGADGDGEDAVYYSVKRTIDGSTVRFLEKWALESECQGGSLNKQVDAHVVGTVSGGILTGLTHLEGEEVAVWVNGADAGTYTVIGGLITNVSADGSAVAGLSYLAQYKSSKLGNLTRKKQASRLALIMKNTHYQGLTYGTDFDNLDPLPLVKDESIIESDTVHVAFDEESFPLDGVWEADARLCLQAQSPRPVTVLAAIIDLEE